MEEFPTIYTNFWDAIIAVPIVVIVTQIIKIFTPISSVYVPLIANIVGLVISVFLAHRGNISAGIFMGLFYGNAAVGVYSSLKTSLISFKEKIKK